MEKTYKEAAHAMQSGVAMEMNYNKQSTDPKHLRVGINSTMVDTAAMARLLMDKGVITMEEYEAALTAEMNKEVERYEKHLSELIGGNITLG